MPNGPRLILDNVCYHIYSRANHLKKIFIDSADYEYFLLKLKKYKRKFNLKLYAYCLMPTHFHILGECKNAKDISKLMQCLNRSITAYFNKKYKTVGHLWQGRFKSRVVTRNKYLLDLIDYIEANPIRKGLVNSIADWPYSSYRERALGNKTYDLLDDLMI